MGIRQRPAMSVQDFLDEGLVLERWLSEQARHIKEHEAQLSYSRTPQGVEVVLTAADHSGRMLIRADGGIETMVDHGGGFRTDTALASDHWAVMTLFGQFRRSVLGGIVPPLPRT